jgi:hypothetical protein
MAITQGASANAIAHPNQSRKFITTEPLSKSGEAGEQKVWDAVVRLLPIANVLATGAIQSFLKWKVPQRT